jgi:hypothetical protein
MMPVIRFPFPWRDTEMIRLVPAFELCRPTLPLLLHSSFTKERPNHCLQSLTVTTHSGLLGNLASRPIDVLPAIQA